MVSNRQLFLDHLAQTSGSPMMVEVESAKGIYMYGPEGEEYIDLISGVNVSAIGHSHPAIIQAVKDQVDKYMHLMVYGEFIQSPQVRYAGMITSHLPSSLSNVYYVNSGSEAIEGAVKLAKRFTGKSKIASFRNAYHGSTHGALSILGNEYFKDAYRPLLPGVVQMEFNDPRSLEKIDNDTACVVAEVMQAEAGVIVQENNFLLKLRERCNETGTLLIFDEIQTGLGRLGSLFGFEKYRVTPDILVLAKSFGGGMPLGAFISSKEIMHSLTDNPVLGHITTFGGHPVCCAAGMACFNEIISHDLSLKAIAKGNLFREQLNHPAIKEIRGEGLLLAVELGDVEMMHKIIKAGCEKGFVSDWFLFCESAFRISPPLNITEEEIIKVSEMIKEALDSVYIQ